MRSFLQLGGSPGSLQTPLEGWSMPHLGAGGRRHLAGPQLGGGGGGLATGGVFTLGNSADATNQACPCQPSTISLDAPAHGELCKGLWTKQSLSLPEASHQWRTNPRWRPAPNHAPSTEPNMQTDNRLGADGGPPKSGGLLLGLGGGGFCNHKQVGMGWVVPIPFLPVSGPHPPPGAPRPPTGKAFLTSPSPERVPASSVSRWTAFAE